MKKPASPLTTAGIIFVTMGVLILLFPHLLQTLVATGLILVGVFFIQFGGFR